MSFFSYKLLFLKLVKTSMIKGVFKDSVPSYLYLESNWGIRKLKLS